MWLKLVFALPALLVLVAEDFFNPFILWNWLPIGAAYYLLERIRKEIHQSEVWPPVRQIAGSVAFTLLGVGLVVLGHLAWMFNWEGTRTASSTSALILLFLPIYAMVSGGVAYGLGWLLGLGYDRLALRRRDRP